MTTTRMTLAPEIQVVRVDLTDYNAMRQLSQPRTREEYTPLYMDSHPFLLPPGSDRLRYSSLGLDDLREQAQKHEIEDAHIRIIRQRLLYPTVDTMQYCAAPLHVATAFRYQGVRIVGPSFVSMLHAVMALLPETYWHRSWAASLREVRKKLSPQERQALIQYYMCAYIKGSSSCTDLTIITIPARLMRETSPTHLAFLPLAMPWPGTNEYVLSLEGADLYAFAHSNDVHALEQVQRLLADPTFVEKLNLFQWSASLFEKLRLTVEAESQIPGFNALCLRQACIINECLRATWKNAEKGLFESGQE